MDMPALAKKLTKEGRVTGPELPAVTWEVKVIRCRHCNRNKAMAQRRMLCDACYYTPKILRLYPAKTKPEPTMEELDALVAKQMEDLPDWWWDDDPDEMLDPPLRRNTYGLGNIRVIAMKRPRWLPHGDQGESR